MKRIISIICIIMIVLSFCGCGTKLEGGQPEGEITSNGGIAVKQGDWYYFINGSMPATAKEALTASNRGRIFRLNGLSGEVQQITDKKAFNLYIFKDKLFYTSPTMKNVVLSVVNIDSTGNRDLLTFDDSEFITYGELGVAVATAGKIIYFDYATCSKKEFAVGDVTDMRISEHYIYFYDQKVAGTKRVEIATGREEKLCDENGMIIYANDTEVYFVSVRVPYKLNANTLELTQISEALYKNLYFNYKNRAIICVESDESVVGLFSQPIDNVAGEAVAESGNKPRTKLHNKAVSAYCANDEFIFFVEAETGDVYKMSYEGTDKTVLGKIDSVFDMDSIDIVGDKLFVFDSVESGKAYVAPIDGSSSFTLAVTEAL